MTKARVVLVTLVVLGAAFLSGCLFVKAPPTGEIEGYVTDHLSGEAVAGATVLAWPMAGRPVYWSDSDYFGPQAVTDDNGYYKLVLPEGMYVVEVRKDGHATSRIEGVKVASTARVDTVLKPVANPNWSLEPPAVTVTGVTEGMTISGPISVKIDAQGPNHIQYIYAAFGKMPGAALLTAPRVIYDRTYTTGTFTIDPYAYGVAGETTFEVVVYDYNENRTHVIYRVYVTPGADGPVSSPSAPTANILTDTYWGVVIPARTALAVTLSKKTGFYSEPLEPLAAPAGANLYVELRWLKAAEDASGVAGDGYRIYRKLEGEDDYTLIYTVDATGAASYLYRDSKPDLAVGRTAYYRITYFRGTAESAPLEAACTPLPAWDVRLVSPADHAENVPLYPTFTWTPSLAPAGTTQYYQMVFWDMGHGPANGILIRAAPNTTSVTYTGIPGTVWERLLPHRMYHWAIRFALDVDLSKNAISIAVNDGYTTTFPTQKPAEMWTFITGDW